MFSTLLNIISVVTLVEGYPVLHLDFSKLNNAASRNILNKELIKEIINVIEQRNGATEITINKCLHERNEDDILLCLKNVANEKTAARSRYKTKNKFFKQFDNARDNQDIFKDNDNHFSHFLDLTRDSEDAVRKGMFNFAEDYVDFPGIGRSGNNNKKKDMSKEKMYFYKPGGKKKHAKKQLRRNLNDNFIAKKILRTNFDSESEEDDSDSNSEDLTRNDVRNSIKYQESTEESNSSEESDYVRQKPKKVKRKDPLKYMQAPTRIFEVDLDRRRRLAHFLPKRFHWSESDFRDLRNHWIHGPQGKYPGSYRIPY
ncbi:unnamed protein product [Colias eurytheme]|nr:unnamed protein product [Colias eurytheme]